MEDLGRVSAYCSTLGQRILWDGDIDALKFVYAASPAEHPAIIKTIEQLQNWLTVVKITKDKAIYSPEFLYYWGMACLGEQSNLIAMDLGIATACFNRIERLVPTASARLAYISLLKSTEPARNGSNPNHLETLRECANRYRDMFSMIALAKICFQSFLEEHQENNPDAPITELPIKTIQLLAQPCQQGHPVAIRFWNRMVDCIQCPLGVIPPRYSETSICPQALYDFKTFTNLQIEP